MGELQIYVGLDKTEYDEINKLLHSSSTCKLWTEVFNVPNSEFIKNHSEKLADPENVVEYTIIGILKEVCEDRVNFELRNKFCKEFIKNIHEAASIQSTSVIKNAATNILYWFSQLHTDLINPKTSLVVKCSKHSKYGCWFLKILADCGYSIKYITLSSNIFFVHQNEDYYGVITRCSKNESEWETWYNKLVDYTKEKPVTTEVRETSIKVKVEIPLRPYLVPKYTKSEFSDLDELISNMKLNKLCSCVICGCGDNYGVTHNKLFELRKILTVIDSDYESLTYNAIKCRPDGETILVMNNRLTTKKSITELKELRPTSSEGIRLVAETAEEISQGISCRELRNLYRNMIEWYFREKANSLKELYNISILVASKLEAYTPKVNGIVGYFGDIGQLPVESILYLNIVSKYKTSTILINWNIESLEDREDGYSLLCGDWVEIQLGKACDKTEYPKGELRVKASTLAHEASQEIEDLLYNGQTLGLYKVNQFNTNNSLVLSTTFDEIALLWKNEAVARPNFKVDAENNIVTIPTIFADIVGTANMTDSEFAYKIRELITDHTNIYVNEHIRFDQSSQTSFIKFMTNVDEECMINNVKLIENGKILRDNVKDIWVYNRLNTNKQELMLNKMQEVIDNCAYIEFGDGKLQKIMVAMLTLPQPILNDIIWFDFTKMSPKIIMVFNNTKNGLGQDNIISPVDCIRLYFCNLIGFDIAVFTPTAFKSLDSTLDSSIYEYYDLGCPRFDVSLPGNIKTRLEDKPEGFFKRMFKWRN